MLQGDVILLEASSCELDGECTCSTRPKVGDCTQNKSARGCLRLILSATAVHHKCTRCPETFIFPALSMFTGACGHIVWPRPPVEVADKDSGRQASRADNAGCLHRWPRLTQKKSPRKSKAGGRGVGGGRRPDQSRPAGEERARVVVGGRGRCRGGLDRCQTRLKVKGQDVSPRRALLLHRQRLPDAPQRLEAQL